MSEQPKMLRVISIGMVLLLGACAGLADAPARAPSTDVNPITGSRGGGGGSGGGSH